MITITRESLTMVDMLKDGVKGGVVAVDTETTGLMYWGTPEELGHHPARAFLITFTDYEMNCDYVWFDVDPKTRKVLYDNNLEGMHKLRTLLGDKSTTKVLHNANFDVSILERAGVEIKGKILDTMTMAHVENSSRMTFQLKPLTKAIMNIGDDDQRKLKASVVSGRRLAKKHGWPRSPDVAGDYHLGDKDLCITYGLADTVRTMALYIFYEEKYNTDEDYKSVIEMEMKLQTVIRKVQNYGITIDTDQAAEVLKYYERLLQDAINKKEELGYGELNTRSSPQMQKVFYEDKGYAKIMRKKKNAQPKPTTDGKALEEWARKGDKLAEVILRINACEHALSSFIRPIVDDAVTDEVLLSDGKVLHPNYVCNGPITGRLSCRKPNLMNVPSNDSAGRKTDIEYRARECFVAREGHLLYFPDYSQVEVWTSMFLAQEPTGMKMLLEDMDAHGELAKRIWGDRADYAKNKKRYRKMAKFVVFGIIYGSGPEGLGDLIGVPTSEGARIKDEFYAMYPGLARYSNELQRLLRTKGFVKNPFGRSYSVESWEAYKILNYMVQGTCADIMKRAIINVHDMLHKKWPGARVLMNIHDELGIEIPKAYHSKAIMKDIVEAMQGNFHEIIGIPKPLGVGMKFTASDWHSVIELDEQFNPIED